MQGTRIANYQVLEKLGEGGMGSVYLAHDLSLERRVAIKVISPELAHNSQLMQRFRIEAIAQARFNHSNIVTIHSFDHVNELYYIVMEYVDGSTLKSIISEKGQLTIPQSLMILSHILSGLAYAHSKGVLHRDIKPANIFITTDNSVKIGDFGIAKVEGFDGLTRVGSAIGTPLYSSPEQIRGAKMGPGTDIYSIGVTFYEMVTGIPPFGSSKSSNFEIQQAHLEKTPRKPSTVNAAIPSYIDTVIMKSLSKNPDDRYKSATDFKNEIDCLLQRENLSGTPGRGIILPQPKLPKISIPRIKLSDVKLSNLKNKKIQVNNPGLQRILKPIQDVLKGPLLPQPGQPYDRRKLLIILIPLLILILIAIAYSEDHQSIEKNKLLKIQVASKHYIGAHFITNEKEE